MTEPTPGILLPPREVANPAAGETTVCSGAPPAFVMRAARSNDLPTIRSLAETHQRGDHACGEFADVLDRVRISGTGEAELDNGALWALADTGSGRVIGAMALDYQLTPRGDGLLVQMGQVSDLAYAHDRPDTLMATWILDLAWRHRGIVAEVRRVSNCVTAITEGQRAGWSSETERVQGMGQQVLCHRPRTADSLAAYVQARGVPTVLPSATGPFGVVPLRGGRQGDREALTHFLEEVSPDEAPMYPVGIGLAPWRGRAVLHEGRLVAVVTEHHAGKGGIPGWPTLTDPALHLSEIRTQPSHAEEALRALARWAILTAAAMDLRVQIEADTATAHTLRGAGLHPRRIRSMGTGLRYLLSSPPSSDCTSDSAAGSSPQRQATDGVA
ncbi:hypothetical protein [Streptomyces sp. NPDC054865]